MANCHNHPDAPAVAYCRACGKPMCQACERFAQGTVFCDEHLPAPRSPETPYASPYTAPAPAAAAASSDVSPGLAFVLGLIPGVGAIYNGQYVKGLVHVAIFGLLISIAHSGATGELQPLFIVTLMAWVPYMAFEAYHTARKRQRGEAVDEFSSILPLQKQGTSRIPIGPVILIGLGVLFLLNNLELIRFYYIVRYWPVFLIALGVYMLYIRLTGEDQSQPGRPSGILPGSTGIINEAPHEQ